MRSRRSDDDIELRGLAGMSSADAPLMAGVDREDEDDDEDGGSSSSSRRDDGRPTPKAGEDDAPPTRFLYYLTLSTCISGLLFGCRFHPPRSLLPVPLSPTHTQS